MENHVRILGIVPYEGMKMAMASLSQDYPQIELTIFVGDLEQGVAIARNNFHEDYDVIVSRGGTAKLLQEQIPLPVVEVDVSIYDILCTLRLANRAGQKFAMVCYENIAQASGRLFELLDCQIDIFTINSPEKAELVLLELNAKTYDAILCDMVANTMAKRMGLNSFLITSGNDSIRASFERALQIHQSRQVLRDENQFFRKVIRGQVGQTVIFHEDGTLYFSTQGTPDLRLLELFKSELIRVNDEEHKIIRTLNGMIYTIRIQRITTGKLTLIAFFFVSRKAPPQSSQKGIHYYSRYEIDDNFCKDGYYIGAYSSLREKITRITKATAPSVPVMIIGENGTQKETIADMLYLRGPLSKAPFVSINCRLLNERALEFLLENHNSPLLDSRITIFVSNLETLIDERRLRFIEAIEEMNVCRCNHVIFSCRCQYQASLPSAMTEVMDKFGCVSLLLPPLRCNPDYIPTLANIALSHINAALPHQILAIEDEAVRYLRQYSWPHNYSQFRRILKQLAIESTTQIITADSVKSALKKESDSVPMSFDGINDATPLDLNRPMDEITVDIVKRLLADNKNNLTAVANKLHLSRTTVWRMLKRDSNS